LPHLGDTLALPDQAHRCGVAGDLQAVEQEAGAFGVDVVGGEAAQDLGDGELDGGAVDVL